MPVLNIGGSGGGDADAGGVCAPWADIADACAPCDEYDFDPGAIEDGIAFASEVLFNLTGRRWSGICTTTVRPTACGCTAYSGLWRAGGVCGCGCSGVSEIILPSYPVVDILDVRIDGLPVDAARYRVDDRQRLVFQPDLDDSDGRRGWPCCQRLSRPEGEEGTWSITYSHGQDPPLGGVRAAASLGCQLALSCLPADDPHAKQCRLPKRVTSITRQQVTLAIIDPLSLFKDGLTGLPEVDLWVQSVMLGDQRRRGRASVPGRPRARRTT